MSFGVVLLCGGQGTRMGHATPKQFLLLNEKKIADYSFELFQSMPEIEEIVVVVEEEYRGFFPNALFARARIRRQDSVKNGMNALSDKIDYVIVHDGARPFPPKSGIESAMHEAKLHGASVLGIAVKNTMKQIDSNQFVVQTLQREELVEIQTPQVIKRSLLVRGFELADSLQITVTDDVSLVELLREPVKVVKGSVSNIKITVPEDLKIAHALLSQL